MKREYYADTIAHFLSTHTDEIIGQLATNSDFPVEQSQINAWIHEIDILRDVLPPYQGKIYLEYSIPRMGRRIDAVLLIGPAIFVIEFKVGARDFAVADVDQVVDYALDLKNFHESSHEQYVAPVLIATAAEQAMPYVGVTAHNDKLLLPIKCNVSGLRQTFDAVLTFVDGTTIDPREWEHGRYCPTPTIVEAAMALYSGHSVEEISRSDAGAINLHQTSDAIAEIIRLSRQSSHKAICFVTGVPGVGKTLVGLNIANSHSDASNELYSVYLSGNAPLVAILREALARDKVRQEGDRGVKQRKGEARSIVKKFIQNVHHFRDECLIDAKRPPIEHVALFDEAQRAWNVEQTSKFMRIKKKVADFSLSEPEFLISCMDRHPDWAVIVCLVGGGQEINTGEAGISEWIESLNRAYPRWRIFISSRLSDGEYGAGSVLERIRARAHVVQRDELHLAVSMRSFRAENVSLLVKQLLDLDPDEARRTLSNLEDRYPIVLTRDLAKAKKWLRDQARGTERYGIVVSSHAERLKPQAIDVKSPMDPIHWFLDGKEDVRSSYYLEDVATEFDIQGLELDWACVTWDADFRYANNEWEHWSFCGDRWNRIRRSERQAYQKNAYRVLLTRARQGMVIVVPSGDSEDSTRKHEYYDPTFEYLRDIGFAVI